MRKVIVYVNKIGGNYGKIMDINKNVLRILRIMING